MERRRDLAVSLSKLAELAEARREYAEALEFYEKVLSICLELQEQFPIHAIFHEDVAENQEAIQRIKSNLLPKP